jgi:hypothetical protein
MTPASPLDQLRDIHLPADIGWWPLAPSWWILMIALATLITTLTILYLKHRRKNAWRKSALKELKLICAEHSNMSSEQTAIKVSILIKRCLASANPSTPNTLSATGIQLANQLTSFTKDNQLSESLINLVSYDIYKTDCPKIEIKDLQRIQGWIKGLNNA